MIQEILVIIIVSALIGMIAGWILYKIKDKSEKRKRERNISEKMKNQKYVFPKAIDDLNQKIEDIKDRPLEIKVPDIKSPKTKTKKATKQKKVIKDIKKKSKKKVRKK